MIMAASGSNSSLAVNLASDQAHPDLYPRIAGKVDANKFKNVVITARNCAELGSMYSTDGIPGYGASFLRVVQNSPLFVVLCMLTEDVGFRTALGIPEAFSLFDLPTMVDPVTKVPYVVNVQADIVWAALAFIHNTWGVKYGLTMTLNVSEMPDAEFYQLLGRMQITPKDTEDIMTHRKAHPEAVNTVFNALIRQSALLAAVVAKDKQRKEVVVPRPEDLPSVPESAPEDPAATGDANPSEEVVVVAPDDEASDHAIGNESRKISNAEIADELCDYVMRRANANVVFSEDNAQHFCEVIRQTLHELTEAGTIIAEMDPYSQANMIGSSSALTIAFAYTLLSAENNAYLERLVDALLLVSEPDEQADDEPGPSE